MCKLDDVRLWPWDEGAYVLPLIWCQVWWSVIGGSWDVIDFVRISPFLGVSLRVAMETMHF